MSKKSTTLGEPIEGNEEVFEITDFTCVTDLECFAAALETVIHDWELGGGKSDGVKRKTAENLPKDFLQTCEWGFQNTKVTYGSKIAFHVTHYYPEGLPNSPKIDDDSQEDDALAHLHVPAKDLLSQDSDFYLNSVITAQYGVYEFLVLSPVLEHSACVDSEDFLNMILSGISIATINADCHLPIFVQYDKALRYLFSGVSQNRNASTNFDGAHLKTGLAKHRHLSGIIDMFKEKVNCPITEHPSITVSIQLDYVLEEAVDLPSEMPSHELEEIDNRSFSNFSLPVGGESDPIREFCLKVSWPRMKEEIINETEFYSDLDSTLKRILELSTSSKSQFRVDYYSGKSFSDSPEKAFNALSRNYASAPNQLNFITNPTGVSPGASVNMPLSEESLSNAMNFIFEKKVMSFDEEPFEHLTSDESAASFEEGYRRFVEKTDEVLRLSKSADKNSLAERISIVLAKSFVADNSSNEIVAFSQVWDEVVTKLRDFWENNEHLPGLPETAPPDYSKCRLYQKLQMLQCCIDSRRKRHKLFDENRMFIGYEDDEFFDANEEFLSDDEDSSAKKAKVAASMDANREPMGRLHPLNDLTLLNYPDRPLFVPVTQDRSPMTEDMLEEHAEYLSSLDEGEARVRAQIGTLQSDMKAFKAANPGCCMEDFVRWHSPRDWIPDETGGRLSDRMTSVENNIWVETWNNAMARPVIHQDRLFNEVKEAEQILHAFAHIKVQDLLLLILPVAFTTSIRKLVEEAAECYTLVEEKILKLANKVVHVCRNSQDQDDYLDLLREIMIIEKVISQYLALRSRFTAQNEVQSSLLPSAKSPELRDFCLAILKKQAAAPIIGPKLPDSTEPVRVMDAPNGPLAMAIRYLFNEDARVRPSSRDKREKLKDVELKFPPPNRKHYVLRWLIPRRGPGSRPMAQRMYVLVGDDPKEFRVCTSITSDTTFY